MFFKNTETHPFVGWAFAEMPGLAVRSSVSFSQTSPQQGPPACQPQWPRCLLLSGGSRPGLCTLPLLPFLGVFFCFGFRSITFGFYLFAFRRLSSILVRSPRPGGLCCVPALLRVCLPVTWVTCQTLLGQRVSAHVKWGFTDRTPWSAGLVCSSDAADLPLASGLWLFSPFR